MKQKKRRLIGIILYGIKHFFNFVACFTGWVFIFMCVFGFFNPLSIFDVKYEILYHDYVYLEDKNNWLNERLDECKNITNPKFVAMVINGLEENYGNCTK